MRSCTRDSLRRARRPAASLGGRSWAAALERDFGSVAQLAERRFAATWARPWPAARAGSCCAWSAARRSWPAEPVGRRPHPCVSPDGILLAPLGADTYEHALPPRLPGANAGAYVDAFMNNVRWGSSRLACVRARARIAASPAAAALPPSRSGTATCWKVAAGLRSSMSAWRMTSSRP